MGMTPKEFKDYTNEEYRKRLEERKIPREEMEEYVKARGWQKVEWEYEKDLIIPMWNRTDDVCGSCSLEVAYANAKLNDPDGNDMGLNEWCKKHAGTKERFTKEFSCNKCLKPILVYEENIDGEKFPVGYYGSETKYSGGYNSTPLIDTMIYEFILCEQCLHDFMLTFKMPPKINTYMP